MDYRLPAAQFRREDSPFQRLLGYHRRFGDYLLPALPDILASQSTTQEQRIELYGLLLAKARSELPFLSDVRSERIEMHHEADPGYTKALAQLGITDYCGLCEANAKPWLGMPEFPCFSSSTDCRKPDQGDSGEVVAHPWDFCGGWHSLRPVSWHYNVAEGDRSLAEHCLRETLEELANLTEFSGHPAFALPLYDGVLDLDYPNPNFQCILDETSADGDADRERAMPRFVERYQRFMVFEAPKEHQGGLRSICGHR